MNSVKKNFEQISEKLAAYMNGEDGKKITVVMLNDFGCPCVMQMKIHGVKLTSYAQYSNAFEIGCTPKNKRNKYGLTLHEGKNFAIFADWVNSSFSMPNMFSDLEKTLNYLDGNRTAEVNLSEVLHDAENRWETKNIRCKYFSVTFYKKGTCHIVFHEECRRLIDALNIYAARNFKWLPPSYGQKHYHEMDDKEKKVIDEFQGEQAYETVMQDKAGYLIGDTKPAVLMLN